MSWETSAACSCSLSPRCQDLRAWAAIAGARVLLLGLLTPTDVLTRSSQGRPSVLRQVFDQSLCSGFFRAQNEPTLIADDRDSPYFAVEDGD